MGTGKLEVEVGNWEEDVEELIFDTTTTSNTIINCPNLRREREREYRQQHTVVQVQQISVNCVEC